MKRQTKRYLIAGYRYAIRTLIAGLLVLSIHGIAYGRQKQISGELKNSTGKAIPYATVMLKDNQGHVIAYKNSDLAGKYAVALPDTAQLTALYLEINFLGYKKVRQQLSDGKYVYDIMLEDVAIDIPEIQVRNKPRIISKGDTLSYDVSSFARPEDRSIGDVMKHMPGIEVGEDGTIYYNGKAIFNLYNDGDDLMGGRYGLATKTITKDMIKSVDIIQNFQPIKVLKDKVFTDNVAINLVLKDENSFKLSGQGMLGGGFPEQFDAAMNAIILNKKFKMLNSLKANNSGVDYRADFNQLGNANFSGTTESSYSSPLLSAGTAGNPDLPRGNYYINRSGIINANNLVNTKGGLQFKSNIQAFIDRNTLNYRSKTENYLSGDTVRYNELQNAVQRPFLVYTSLTAMANKSTYYLDNNLRFNISGGTNSSYMDFNSTAFNQQLRDRTYDISNDLSWIPAIKNRDLVMDLSWHINYYNNPQQLYVGSGLNSDILNGGLPYSAINQYAETPTLFSNVAGSFRFMNHLIKQNYRAGITNERQQLNSTLSLTDLNNNESDYKGDAGNALHWQRDKIYINAEYSIRKESWEANITLPLSLQSIRYNQDIYNLDRQKSQFLFNPAARFKYFFNPEDYLLANYSYNNSVGNISGVYRGIILANYRSLFANNAELQEKNSAISSLNYNFQRSIIMLFINAGVTYSQVTANSILSSVLTDNIQRSVLLPYENDQSNLMLSAGVSKYLFAINTTVSFKSALNTARYDQFINAQRLPFVNRSLVLTAAIDAKFFKTITFNYAGTGMWNTSRRQSTEDGVNALRNKIKRLDQNITLGYSPLSNLFLNVKGRHIFGSQANVSNISYLFLDANARYKLVKWRTDLEFNVTNLANVKEYEILSLSSNQFSTNRYDIRGRMAIVRLTFNL